MLVIIPIFFKPHEDFNDTFPLIERLLAEVNLCYSFSGVAVYSNDQAVITMAEQHGLTAYHIACDTQDERKFLPFGSLSAMRSLNEHAQWPRQNCLFINFRNSVVDAAFLGRVLTQFESCKKTALISVKKASDNPCQLKSYYSIESVGYIHLFEHDTPFGNQLPAVPIPKILETTRPFYFDWGRQEISQGKTLTFYKRQLCGSRLVFKEIEISSMMTLDNFPVWIYEGPRKARLIYLPATSACNKTSGYIGTDPVGSTLPDIHGQIFISVHHGENSSPYLFSLHNAISFDSSYVLHIVAIGVDGAKKAIVERRINDLPVPVRLSCKQTDLSGFIYMLLRIATHDTYDASISFPSLPNLWRVDSRKEKIINAKTGNVVSGRQDFPDVYEPDGTCCVVHPDSFAQLDHLVRNGSVAGLILATHEAMPVNFKADYLRQPVRGKTLSSCIA